MKTKKLTQRMISVLSKAINDIERAKKFDYSEWLMEINYRWDYRPERFIHWDNQEDVKREMEEAKKRHDEAVEQGKLRMTYDNNRNNIAYTIYVNSGTLRALEDRGYIRIIHDSCGEKYGSDKIEVLKFEW